MNWVDEFMQLYMSNDLVDFSRALQLKRDNVPKKLYRFRSIETGEKLARVINEIALSQIYLAHPKDLNDPFEMRSPLSSRNSTDYLGKGNFCGSKYREAVVAHFGEEKAKELDRCNNWYERYQEMFSERIANEYGKPVTEFATLMDKIQMEQIEALNSAFNLIFSLSRVASFSEDYGNLPMWDHYADSYSGVCFEFSTTDIAQNIHYINNLFPVVYVDKLPDAVQSGFVRMNSADRSHLFGLINYHVLHKLADWKYEKEWRLIFNAGDFFASP